MEFSDAVIPLGACWSSPFVRWQGPASGINSLDLAAQVTADALTRSASGWEFEQLILGLTVPQRGSFYAASTLAARLGFGSLSGPTIMQACATSVASLQVAALAHEQSSQAQLVVTADRTSNAPLLVYPETRGVGGAPSTEHWQLDNFACDPVTGESMLATGERVAREAGFSKTELDAVTVRRYEQYLDALAADRAFQRDWMIPIVTGTHRQPEIIEADSGVRPVTHEGLGGLSAVTPGGLISYGTQTHPADGCAGVVVTSRSQARELGIDGPLARILATASARVEPGYMPKAPVPAAKAALSQARIEVSGVDVIKTHNPFAVNDLWLAHELGVNVDDLNPFGCSLIYGHPQAPTGMRAVIEMLFALKRRGGGVGLFTGCAAGDSGAAVVVRVD